MDPTARVSAAATTQAVLQEVNAAHGSRYELIQGLAGGIQSGAWLIHDEADRLAVLKWTPDPIWAAQIQRASHSVAVARQRDYPTPAWLAVGTTEQGIGYQVQQYVAGRRSEHLTEQVARQAIDVLEIAADLDPDPERSWSSYVDSAMNDWSTTSTSVAAAGHGGVELVQRATQMLDRYERPVFPTTDLVHGDFRLGNILFDDGSLTGVIDIEAVGSGTRAFDYATLLDHDSADDTAVQLLVDAGVQSAGPAVLAYCIAHVFTDLALLMHRRRSAVHHCARRTASLTTRIDTISTLLV